MEPTRSSDKNTSHNPLLSAYSVKEIIQILKKIDENIVALHGCSSDDFLTLNTHFKNYYRESKTVAENASSLFDIISGETNRQFHDNLLSVQEKVVLLIDQFDQFIQRSSRLIEELFRQLHLMFVPLNNYRQNISTLKYLSVNLTINARYGEMQKEEAIRDDSREIALLIEGLKQKLHSFDLSMGHAKKSHSNILSRLDELRTSTVDQITSISEQVGSSISVLSKKHCEAVKKIPALRETTENSSASIAKIITNLQYHDIIRQKIEHIQTTQKEILAELQTFEDKEDDNTSLHHQAKVFMKIRDIAGLQAAQLLHANKEYQMAIENITNRFVEIGDQMTTITSLCQELSTYHEGSGSTLFDEILLNLGNAKKLTESFTTGSAKFENNLAAFHTEFSNVQQQFREIVVQDGILHALIAKTLEDSRNEGQAELNTVQQISSLFTDITSSMGQSKEMMENCRQLGEDLKQQIMIVSADNEFSRSIAGFSQKLPALLENLKADNLTLQNLLAETTNVCENIVGSVKTSIQNVKYYDYFEKIIDEIINELNTINIRLHAGDQADPAMKERNLRLLKEKYTMQSEHDIHDHITAAGSKHIDLLSQKNAIKTEEVDDNDDNLELF